MYEKQEKLKTIQEFKPKSEKPKSLNKVDMLQKIYD